MAVWSSDRCSTRGRTHARKAVVALFLQELIVGGASAEARWQDLVEHPHDARVEERHPARGELLEAPDAVEVRGPAQRVERAAARPWSQRRAIAHRDVEEDDRRGRAQRRDQERSGGEAGDGVVRADLDQRVEVLEEVDLVRMLGRETPVGEEPGLGAAVVDHGLDPGLANRRQPARGDRLARDREPGAADVESHLERDPAQSDGRADEGPEVRDPPGAQHLGHPAEDGRRIAHRHVLGAGQRQPVEERRGAQEARAPPVVRPEARRGGVDEHEAASGRRPEAAEADGDAERARRHAPDALHPVPAAARVEREAGVDGAVAQALEVDGHVARRPPAATRSSRHVGSGERIARVW